MTGRPLLDACLAFAGAGITGFLCLAIIDRLTQSSSR